MWGYNRFSSLGLGPTRDGDRVISSPVATQQFDRIVDGVGRGKPRSVACGRFFTVVSTACACRRSCITAMSLHQWRDSLPQSPYALQVACHAFEEGVLRGGADGRRLSLLEAELKNAAYTELSRKIVRLMAAYRDDTDLPIARGLTVLARFIMIAGHGVGRGGGAPAPAGCAQRPPVCRDTAVHAVRCLPWLRARPLQSDALHILRPPAHAAQHRAGA